VRAFTRFLGRSPDTTTARHYQLHLVGHGATLGSLNAVIAGPKFFLWAALYESDLMARPQPVRLPRVLSVVLNSDEVNHLVAATGNLKHQTAPSVVYGAGLRQWSGCAEGGDVDGIEQRLTL